MAPAAREPTPAARPRPLWLLLALSLQTLSPRPPSKDRKEAAVGVGAQGGRAWPFPEVNTGCAGAQGPDAEGRDQRHCGNKRALCGLRLVSAVQTQLPGRGASGARAVHGRRGDGGRPVLLQTPWAGRGAAPARRFCRTGVHRRCAAKGLGAAVPKALGRGTLSEDRWKHWVCTVKSAEGGKDMGSRQSGSAKPPFPGWGVRLHSHPLRWGAPHRPGPCGSGGHLPSTQRGGSLDSEGDVRLHSRTRGLSLRPRPDTRSRTQLPQAASMAPRQLSAPLLRRARFRLALWGCGD